VREFQGFKVSRFQGFKVEAGLAACLFCVVRPAFPIFAKGGRMWATCGRMWGTLSCLRLEAGALVLFGPLHILLEDVGGAEGPIGLAEELTSQQDYVGLSGGNDVLGLLG